MRDESEQSEGGQSDTPALVMLLLWGWLAFVLFMHISKYRYFFIKLLQLRGVA